MFFFQLYRRSFFADYYVHNFEKGFVENFFLTIVYDGKQIQKLSSLLCPLSFNFAFQFRDIRKKLCNWNSEVPCFLKNIIRNLTMIPILS